MAAAAYLCKYGFVGAYTQFESRGVPEDCAHSDIPEARVVVPREFFGNGWVQHDRRFHGTQERIRSPKQPMSEAVDT
jgi:hypothetical protein